MKKYFFNGDEFEKLSKEFNLELDDLNVILKKSFNYAGFLYLIAEIFEEKNISSIDKLFLIMFEKNKYFDKSKKLVIDFVNYDKSRYFPIEFFDKLEILHFNKIIHNIQNITSNDMIIRRVEHGFLESMFTDLFDVESLGFATSITKLTNIDLVDIVLILEKNGFILASRNIITLLRQQREKITSDAYSKGELPNLAKYTKNSFFDCGKRDVYLDTSKEIRELRSKFLPSGMQLYETTPKAQNNPNYCFSKFEIKWLKHYFEKVREAEILKGDCFTGKIKETYDNFMKDDYKKLKEYLEKKFGKNRENLKNMVITGIGGNEMLIHLVKSYSKDINVFDISHPSQFEDEVGYKYNDINSNNTLIIGTTRSGNTHEPKITVEFFERLFNNNLSIVSVCNSGEISELTKKHSGVNVQFPYGVAGRLSTFVTSVLLVPIIIIDEKKTKELFEKAHELDMKLTIQQKDSISYLGAKKMFIQSFVQGGKTDILLCGNSNTAMKNHRHIIQIAMEGIKHPLKTILTYGMPNTAHHQIEQLMKFVYSYYGWWIIDSKPTKSICCGEDLDKFKINSRTINEDNIALTIAQLRTLMQQSPTSVMVCDDILSPTTQAFIYKHTENVMYYLARLFGDSPENNPIVKDTRNYADLYTKKFVEENKTIIEHFEELEKIIDNL